MLTGGRRGNSAKLVTIAMLAAVLSGCALFGGSKPLDTYELTTPRQADNQPRGRTQILIAEPSALKALDGQNIVIRPAPGSVEFLRGAQWSDRLPKIVQARLAETFQRSGRFGGVGRPGEGLAIDYQVLTDIRVFEIKVEGSARAEIELFVSILNDRTGVVRTSRTFRTAAPVTGTGNSAFASALDQAFGSAAIEIVAWVDRII